jgi:hypothetical protein
MTSETFPKARTKLPGTPPCKTLTFLQALEHW